MTIFFIDSVKITDFAHLGKNFLIHLIGLILLFCV